MTTTEPRTTRAAGHVPTTLHSRVAPVARPVVPVHPLSERLSSIATLLTAEDLLGGLAAGP